MFLHMFQDLQDYIKILQNNQENIVKKNAQTVENIFSICDTLIKTQKTEHNVLQEYLQLKEKYKTNACKSYTEESEKVDQKVSLIDEHDVRLMEIREKRMKDLNNRIDEVIDINDYISCLAKYQGEQIDSINTMLQFNQAKTENTVKELRKTYEKKIRKRKWFIFILYIVVFLCCIWFGKIILFHFLNKFL